MAVRILFLCLVTCAVGTGAWSADWPWWRGPQHDGHSVESSGFEQGAWPLQAPAWQAEVGLGAASVAVNGDRLYTLGFRRWSDGYEAVTCLNAATGQQLWEQAYRAPEYGRRHHGDEGWYRGPSATPTLDLQTGLLYTLGIDGSLNCWDTAREGQRLWGLNLYDSYKVLPRPDLGAGQRDYGYTTAPLVYQDWLLVQVGADTGTVAALDKRTGKPVWMSTHKGPPGHVAGMTPTMIDNIPCVIVFTLQEVLAVRLDAGHQGETLCSYPWATHFGCNLPTPAVQGNTIIVTSGYNVSRTECLELSANGARKVWENRASSRICSPVIIDDCVYLAWQKLQCLDLATGQVRWSGGEFGDDTSMLATTDKRLIVFGSMKLALVDSAAQSANQYRELATTAPLGKGPGWPHVVLASGQLLAKSAAGKIWCFRLAE